MRTIKSDRVNYLSVRLDHIPGIQPMTKAFVNKKVAADKSIGIKSDRKVFLAEVPKCTGTTKVRMQNIISYVYYIVAFFFLKLKFYSIHFV